LHKVLAENTTRRCGDFPDKPSGTDLLKATSPVLPLRIKRNQHRLMAHQSGIDGRESQYGKQKRWLPQAR